MFDIGPTNSPLQSGGGNGMWGGGTRRPPHAPPQKFDMRSPGMANNMSPFAGLSMMQRMRMPPPTTVPQGSMSGNFMQPPRMLPGQMMDGAPNMGMITNSGQMPGDQGGLISRLTGGTNTGVVGPRPGGLWNTYANMVQGDGAPQKRNLTY